MKPKKAHSREYMRHVRTGLWKNSPDKTWEDRAKRSYDSISKRAIIIGK